jgi:small subunit ribosomal protein S20
MSHPIFREKVLKTMANHLSAKKRAVRNAKRGQMNKARTSRLRTTLKKVEQAINSGNAKDAEAALKKAQPELSKSVSKGLLKKNTAARKMSRLSAKVKALKKS